MRFFDKDDELELLYGRFVEVIRERHIVDPDTVAGVGMGLISLGLSMRFSEEGEDATKEMRLDIADMIENDLQLISPVP